MRIHWKELEDRTGVIAEKFSCKPCSRYWRVKRDLERHMRTVHGPKILKRETHICQYCGKNFSRLQNRKRHELKMHKNLKVKREEFPCPQCDLVYKYRGQRSRHIKDIHEKESQSTTKHVCQKCGREYARAKQLKNHMRIHSKKYLEAKSTCNICEKDFRCNASLKIHVNAIHNRQRDYACDICGKCFTRSRTLTTHRKIHDDIKQFDCIYCCAAYRDKRNLVNHIQRNHPKSELKFKNKV